MESEGGHSLKFYFWSCWTLFFIELKDLILTSFFKEIMIVLVKLNAAGEVFGKICLKARYIFSNIWFPFKREQEGWAWKKVIHLTFWWGSSERRMDILKNLSMCPPIPCPFLRGKPCIHILNLYYPYSFRFRKCLMNFYSMG